MMDDESACGVHVCVRALVVSVCCECVCVCAKGGITD